MDQSRFVTASTLQRMDDLSLHSGASLKPYKDCSRSYRKKYWHKKSECTNTYYSGRVPFTLHYMIMQLYSKMVERNLIMQSSVLFTHYNLIHHAYSGLQLYSGWCSYTIRYKYSCYSWFLPLNVMPLHLLNVILSAMDGFRTNRTMYAWEFPLFKSI